MESRKYEYQSDFAKRYYGEGREEGRRFSARRMVMQVAQARIGVIEPQVQERIEACDDAERLEKLVLDLSTAGDPAAVEKLLHEL